MYASLGNGFDALIGFPASDPASAGRRRHRYAVRAKVTAGRTDFQERTKRLKDTAYKLRDAGDVVLAEVQHMEAAQERFAERMKNRPDKKARA